MLLHWKSNDNPNTALFYVTFRERAEAGKEIPYLPADKQYLLTRNVPCLLRVEQFGEGAGGGADEFISLDDNKSSSKTKEGMIAASEKKGQMFYSHYWRGEK